MSIEALQQVSLCRELDRAAVRSRLQSCATATVFGEMALELVGYLAALEGAPHAASARGTAVRPAT